MSKKSLSRLKEILTEEYKLYNKAFSFVEKRRGKSDGTLPDLAQPAEEKQDGGSAFQNALGQ